MISEKVNSFSYYITEEAMILEKRDLSDDEMEERIIEQPSEEEAKRFYNLLHTIKCICNCAGFNLTDRISVTDRITGREWH